MRFGGIQAIQGLCFEMGQGDILGVIGPNGAGKTTFFNLLTGVYVPTAGDICFQGKVLNGLAPFRIAQLGIVRTFQNVRLFAGLSVEDTIRAAMIPKAPGFFSSLFSLPASQKSEAVLLSEVEILLKQLGLWAFRHQLAVTLTYGLQRCLEIARALANRPKLLLLDEPAAGMTPTEKMDLMATIRDIQKQFGIAVIIIEHDMRLVMGLCPRILVLDHGVMIADGDPNSIATNPHVISAYLGEPEEGDFDDA